MSKQLIFCVETNKKNNSDWIYIKRSIEKFFIAKNDVKLTPIYMNGKGNFKNTENDIEAAKKKYPGESYVICCVDADKIESNSADKKKFEDIKKYCESKDYELVWFHRDIEDVFLGRTVTNKEKKAEAVRFARSNAIDKINVSKLKGNVVTAAHSSNLYIVLDKYLEKRN